MKDFGPTILRIFVGVTFVMHSYLPLFVFTPAGTANYMAKVAGGPAPARAGGRAQRGGLRFRSYPVRGFGGAGPPRRRRPGDQPRPVVLARSSPLLLLPPHLIPPHPALSPSGARAGWGGIAR